MCSISGASSTLKSADGNAVGAVGVVKEDNTNNQKVCRNLLRFALIFVFISVIKIYLIEFITFE